MPDSAAPANTDPDVGDVNVTVADVLAAQARLRRYLPPTPMHHAERFGVMLKLENLQRTGSYKVRGALNALLAQFKLGEDNSVRYPSTPAPVRESHRAVKSPARALGQKVASAFGARPAAAASAAATAQDWQEF